MSLPAMGRGKLGQVAGDPFRLDNGIVMPRSNDLSADAIGQWRQRRLTRSGLGPDEICNLDDVRQRPAVPVRFSVGASVPSEWWKVTRELFEVMGRGAPPFVDGLIDVTDRHHGKPGAEKPP